MTANAAARSISPLVPAARWWEYVTEGRLFCGPKPDGHHIPATFDLTESGFIRCNHWNDATKQNCGLWVFAYAIRGGRVVVARVTLDEKKAMKHLITPAQMIDYLGIWDQVRPIAQVRDGE